MIEIRELVIRATVEDSPGNNGERNRRDVDTNNAGKKGCCAESIEMMLQIINDKKER